LIQGVLAVEAEPDEGDLCARASAERAYVADVDVAADDLVTEAFDDRPDARESGVLLVRDQHLQTRFGLRRHQCFKLALEGIDCVCW
jgi:hypothetical protein